MKSQHNYKTSTGITFGGREAPMNIGKSRNNFDKSGKPRCFNCNLYEYITRECKRPKKERETRRCYKYSKEEHLAKDCKSKQLMKNRRSQADNSDNKKEEGFVKGLE